MNYNTKKSFMYQLHDDSRSIIICYSIVIAVYIIIFTTTSISIFQNETNNYFAGISGLGFTSAIFAFCACAFKENFQMLIQNGISRKSVYFGRILKSVTLSLIFTMVVLIIKSIFDILTSLFVKNFIFNTLFEITYYEYCMENNVLIILLTSFLFFFVLFLFFNSLGYLMSTVFYRLGTTAKVLFAAGIPIFMFVVFPIIDNRFFEGQIFANLIKLFPKVLGITTQNPFLGILSLTIGAGLFTALSWLPIRRARVE